MTSGLRWTADQLAAYEKKHRRAGAPQTSAAWPAPTTHKKAETMPPAPVKQESELERRFAQQIEAHGLDPAVREYYFLKDRDFRLDFAWPARKLGVEIQGASHRIKGKFHRDLEKRALALIAGWRVLELGWDQVKSEQGIAWLKQLMTIHEGTT
jgi:very-short-patch-repair endonuclease